MKLQTRAIEASLLLTGEGTQVRGRLDPAWVAELAELYRDTGHSIDPVVAVFDGERHYLVDGFHRVAAQVEAFGPHCGIQTQVIEGTLDRAKFLASRANRHGLQRNPGDKKAAILLALSTAEGRQMRGEMGVRALARHCGVSHTYVQMVLGGGDAATTCQPASTSASAESTSRRQLLSPVQMRIDALLAADVDRVRSDVDIAKEVGCDHQRVKLRRRVLGIDAAKETAHGGSARRARALVLEHPEWTNARIVKESGSCGATLKKIREELGPKYAVQKRQTKAPSASKPARAEATSEASASAKVIPITRPRSPADRVVVEWVRAFENMTDEQRTAAVDALRTRWPETFGGAAKEASQ